MKSSLSKPKSQEYTTKLTLIGAFLAAFTVFSMQMPLGRRPGRNFELRPFDMLLLALSTLRLGRMVAFDRVAEPLREPFAKTVPDVTGAGETVEPRGKGARQSIGQLITCPICSGTWIAAGLVYGLHMLPNPTRVFLAITSSAGAAEILNSLIEALSWLGQAGRTYSGEKASFE